MAGAKLSPFGSDIRELILENQKKGGNPTWGTVGAEVLKLAKKHGDKRNDESLMPFFNSQKIALAKKAGAPPTGKKRGRPAGPSAEVESRLIENSEPITSNEKKRGRPTKVTSSHNLDLHYISRGFVAFDLGIKFAKEVGGLDKAIETLQLIKKIKDSA